LCWVTPTSSSFYDPGNFIQALSPTKNQEKNAHDFSIIPSHCEEKEGFQGAFDIRVRAYSLSSLSSSFLIDIGQSHVIFFMFSRLFIWRFPKIGVPHIIQVMDDHGLVLKQGWF
jgi:hypothetical protein